jgi:hypothetical protein
MSKKVVTVDVGEVDPLLLCNNLGHSDFGPHIHDETRTMPGQPVTGDLITPGWEPDPDNPQWLRKQTTIQCNKEDHQSWGPHIHSGTETEYINLTKTVTQPPSIYQRLTNLEAKVSTLQETIQRLASRIGIEEGSEI